MVTLDRLTEPFRRWLYAGGTRQDRLRDPDAVVAALDLRPGMVVGDLGPGAGHFTLRLARAVEPGGVTYALDASQRTLDDLCREADERGINDTPRRCGCLARPARDPRARGLAVRLSDLPPPAQRGRRTLRTRDGICVPGREWPSSSPRREGLLARWRESAMGQRRADYRAR